MEEMLYIPREHTGIYVLYCTVRKNNRRYTVSILTYLNGKLKKRKEKEKERKCKPVELVFQPKFEPSISLIDLCYIRYRSKQSGYIFMMYTVSIESHL
jgi:hypothetical protein